MIRLGNLRADVTRVSFVFSNLDTKAEITVTCSKHEREFRTFCRKLCREETIWEITCATVSVPKRINKIFYDGKFIERQGNVRIT